MGRKRIAASDIFSLPESASSLDVVMGAYPSSVEASMFDYGGDPYLRVAASKKKDEGDVLSAEEIQTKINEWKKHTQDNATNAGFRKANRGRGPMDPRRFALQLSEVARQNAQRYRSPSLARLAKKLRWVAAQDPGVANQALSKMAGPYGGEDREQLVPGMPTLQKPMERPAQGVPPASGLREEPDPGFIPGVPGEFGDDRSWSSQESGRMGKKQIVHDADEDLVTMAREFVQDYQAKNSFSDDDDLIEQLQNPEVFEAWLLDLDRKGRHPDPVELDQAWQEAVNELNEGLEGDENLPTQLVTGSKDNTTIQTQTAPGGDWFNTVINMNENPVMDRYLKDMGDRRGGRSRRAREEKEDARVVHAVDQLLDHYAGEMLLGEISEDHVKEFVGENYPDVDAKKVYADIQKIADPKKRHEEDPKRTNEAASRRKSSPGGALDNVCEVLEQLKVKNLKCDGGSVSFPARKTTTFQSSQSWDRLLAKINTIVTEYNCEMRKEGETFSRYYVITKKDSAAESRSSHVRLASSPFDDFLAETRSGFQKLLGQKEICGACRGVGGGREGCCGHCGGSGRAPVDPDGEDGERKGEVVGRLGSGSLLLVSVDVGNRRVSDRDRRALASLTKSRVASSGRSLVFRHSTGLMEFLVARGIPYRTASYRHPGYQR